MCIRDRGKSAVDAIVIGVGSGGTVTGVGETIKAWTNDEMCIRDRL